MTPPSIEDSDESERRAGAAHVEKRERAAGGEAVRGGGADSEGRTSGDETTDSPLTPFHFRIRHDHPSKLAASAQHS